MADNQNDVATLARAWNQNLAESIFAAILLDWYLERYQEELGQNVASSG